MRNNLEGKDTPELWASDLCGDGGVVAWGWIWFAVGGSRLMEREQPAGVLMKCASKLPVAGAVLNLLENQLGPWLDFPETQEKTTYRGYC